MLLINALRLILNDWCKLMNKNRYKFVEALTYNTYYRHMLEKKKSIVTKMGFRVEAKMRFSWNVIILCLCELDEL